MKKKKWIIVAAAVAVFVVGTLFVSLKKTYEVSTTAAFNTPVEAIGFATFVSHSTSYSWNMQLSDETLLEIEHQGGSLIPQGLFDWGDPLRNMNYTMRVSDSAEITKSEPVTIEFVCAPGEKNNTGKAKKIIRYTLEVRSDRTLTLLKRHAS